MNSKSNRFGFEIGVVLIVKIILIFSLKALFFSDPIDRNLNEQDMSRHLFATEKSAPASRSTPKDFCHVDRTDC